MSKQFTMVMPITQFSYLLSSDKQDPTYAHNNFDRFFQVGLQTYLQYLVWSDVHEFLVILPHNEKDKFDTMLSQYVPNELQHKFVVLKQEDILGPHAKNALDAKLPRAKTRTQMLLKLVIANRVNTDYYVIVDDDVILLRPFGYKHLFADAKQTRLKFTPDSAEHDYWWHGSCNVLHMDWETSWNTLQGLRKRNWVINVTPQVFSKTHTLALLTKLKEKYEDLEKHLYDTSDRWTEYTLYWLHLIQDKQLQTVYRGSRVRISDGSKSVWYACPNLAEKVRIMKNNPYQYFGVIQSNVPEHTIDVVVASMKESILQRSP